LGFNQGLKAVSVGYEGHFYECLLKFDCRCLCYDLRWSVLAGTPTNAISSVIQWEVNQYLSQIDNLFWLKTFNIGNRP